MSGAAPRHLDDDVLVGLALQRGRAVRAPRGAPVAVVDVDRPARADHLASCASCTDRLGGLQRVVEAARPSAPPVEPPASLWDRVAAEAGVATAAGRTTAVDDVERGLVAVSPSGTASDGTAGAAGRGAAGPGGDEHLGTGAPRPRSLPRRALTVLAVAAAAAGLVAAGAALGSGAGTDPGERSVATPATPEPTASREPVAPAVQVLATAGLEPVGGVATDSGSAELDRVDGHRQLVVDAPLTPPAEGHYEVWLVAASGDALVSLGSLTADGTSLAMLVPDDVDVAAYPTVDVSLESADGDPGHSGTSVLRGTLSQT